MLYTSPTPMWKYSQHDLLGLINNTLADMAAHENEEPYEIRKMEVFFVYKGISHPEVEKELLNLGPAIEAALAPSVLCKIMANGKDVRTYFFDVDDIIDIIILNESVNYWYVNTHDSKYVYDWEFVVVGKP